MEFREQITIAGKSEHPFTVNRLGYGTMRLTGPGIYGEPPNREEALLILQEAVREGIHFFDTADYYGEDVTNRLLFEALHPYPDEMLICTKVGATRRPDKSWVPYEKLEDIDRAIDNNLRTLGIEQVQLVHYRVMPGHGLPFEEGMNRMFRLQEQGKIRHIGVSNVSREELELALGMGPIATVENMYGHGQRTTLKTPHGENRGGEELLDLCEKHEIPLIPYFSLINSLPAADDRIDQLAKKHGVSPAQVNIAWLLHRSPWILPIPGTSRLSHFRENLAAARIRLTEEEMDYLD